MRFKLLPGQRSEITGVPDLIEGLTFGAVLADKTFDAEHLRNRLSAEYTQSVIPAGRSRRIHIPHDETISQWWHLIENYFSKIKEFREVNTRYGKTNSSYWER